MFDDGCFFLTFSLETTEIVTHLKSNDLDFDIFVNTKLKMS